MADSCVFCAIVRGQAPASIVGTSERYIVIRPLEPHVPDHLLFVPRIHVADATTATELTGHLFASAAGLLASCGQAGNLLTSVGAEATQTVMHLHVHLLPRGPLDGLEADWPWMREDHRG